MYWVLLSHCVLFVWFERCLVGLIRFMISLIITKHKLYEWMSSQGLGDVTEEWLVQLKWWLVVKLVTLGGGPLGLRMLGLAVTFVRLWPKYVVNTVLDLWENQSHDQSAMYVLTYFDYFFGGSIQTWGVERHQRGVKPSTPSTNRALLKYYLTWYFTDSCRLKTVPNMGLYE